ncbi:iron-sulfur cluster assembly scaffold protein [Qipengyuania sp. XHP0207]|uniref:iron-sulfur cluster assembly scaffold protein n=1 Tax=Qipengyuania sp. XHP0207 TaxID=3038078 RepID=UPI00241F5463|nr:iron-sulfur cluster assembly scaffold protein [Qipengyuania sp. XHP0207]MDG5749350.1 iron-sulfur cluster assembly scaffold protein [Qipengyuania sp. XHP0207]
MTGERREALYSPKLLALAVELARYPLHRDARNIGHARSRTCGSTIALSSAKTDAISSVGMQVSACAVGQAAAAIFANAAEGVSAGELAEALREIEAWLSDDGPLPPWPRLDLLEPARPHSGRHGAILLPWRAALDALSKGDDGR